MILVDSSFWIDHLRRPDAELSSLLADQRVLCHPFAIGELACGFLRQRQALLAALALLPLAPAASHDEAMYFAERHALAGRRVGRAAVHLLASTSLAAAGLLRTRDKRLAAVASRSACCTRRRFTEHGPNGLSATVSCRSPAWRARRLST